MVLLHCRCKENSPITTYNQSIHVKPTSWVNNVAIIELKAFTYLRNVLLNYAFLAQDAIILNNKETGRRECRGGHILCTSRCMSNQCATASTVTVPHDLNCTKTMQDNTVLAHTNLCFKYCYAVIEVLVCYALVISSCRKELKVEHFKELKLFTQHLLTYYAHQNTR